MRPKRIIGWDVGGAHLKAALVEEGVVLKVLQLPCPLWQGLEHLRDALNDAVGQLKGDADLHAVTMTGELADNFANRAEGVTMISEIMITRFGSNQVKIYAGIDGFVGPSGVAHAIEKIASANWLASACWLSKNYDSGLFIDMGSTTTDLIPFSKGQVLAKGFTDLERLREQELVYTGVVRTPLMAITQRAPIKGEWVSLMAEHFATSADIYRILGELTESTDQYPAADDGEKTIAGSERRLAHMLGMEAEDAGRHQWHALAQFFAEQQLRLVSDACTRLFSRTELEKDAPLLGAGVGRFLIQKLAQRLNRPYVDTASLFEIAADDELAGADCVPAVAVALLAACAAT